MSLLFTKEWTLIRDTFTGIVDTDLTQPTIKSWGRLGNVIHYITKKLAKTPENGALTQLYAATSPEIEEKNYKGIYFVPVSKVGKAISAAQNPEFSKKLWDYTDDLIMEKLKIGEK